MPTAEDWLNNGVLNKVTFRFEEALRGKAVSAHVC